MKKTLFVAALLAAGLILPQRGLAVPIPCIVCGSTPLVAPGVDGTVSYAVISGASFSAEVAAHLIGFAGAVPPGTLGPPLLPLPTDFVYLYQPVNDGVDPSPIMGWSISGGGVGPANITAGTRLESTLFVDPDPIFGPAGALVTAGPVAAPTIPGLTGATGTVEFENGLGDPTPVLPVPPWGACLGSGGVGVNCSDAEADLLPTSVLVHGWAETPSMIDLDPFWSGSIVWFASPFGPTAGSTTLVSVTGAAVSGFVPVPTPEPATIGLLSVAVAAIGLVARRRRAA